MIDLRQFNIERETTVALTPVVQQIVKALTEHRIPISAAERVFELVYQVITYRAVEVEPKNIESICYWHECVEVSGRLERPIPKPIVK